MIEFPPRAAFEEWLRAQPPETEIAKNWSCHSCPLANWLKEAYNVDSPYIYDTGYYYMSGDIAEKLVPLPPWAYDFVELVDNCNDENIAVTAADCLNILEKLND